MQADPAGLPVKGLLFDLKPLGAIISVVVSS